MQDEGLVLRQGRQRQGRKEALDVGEQALHE